MAGRSQQIASRKALAARSKKTLVKTLTKKNKIDIMRLSFSTKTNKIQ
jgi:hypothetical protein